MLCSCVLLAEPEPEPRLLVMWPNAWMQIKWFWYTFAIFLQMDPPGKPPDEGGKTWQSFFFPKFVFPWAAFYWSNWVFFSSPFSGGLMESQRLLLNGTVATVPLSGQSIKSHFVTWRKRQIKTDQVCGGYGFIHRMKSTDSTKHSDDSSYSFEFSVFLFFCLFLKLQF